MFPMLSNLFLSSSVCFDSKHIMQETSLSSKIASSQKLKFLAVKGKVQLIRYRDENNGAGVRQTAEMFGTGKTQEKKERRNKRPAEFKQINKAVLDWFCMAQGPMIQEEAREIANRLQMDGYRSGKTIITLPILP